MLCLNAKKYAEHAKIHGKICRIRRHINVGKKNNTSDKQSVKTILHYLADNK